MFAVEVGRVYMSIEGSATNRMRRVVGIRRAGEEVTLERGQVAWQEVDTVFWVDDATGRLHSPKITPIPRKGQTRSGYGRRLPTRYLVRLPGERRWRRVLAICYSNAATLYVDTPAGWVTFY